MGDYKHIDIFSRTEYHQEIDSTRLQNEKSPFKRSNWGENCLFNGRCELLYHIYIYIYILEDPAESGRIRTPKETMPKIDDFEVNTRIYP